MIYSKSMSLRHSADGHRSRSSVDPDHWDGEEASWSFSYRSTGHLGSYGSCEPTVKPSVTLSLRMRWEAINEAL